ncbi:MAG TPA: hypothetical protein VGN17_23010 [Bryobacteraceae bacterium]|jgi:outer membrane lipoprotein-sorting protein
MRASQAAVALAFSLALTRADSLDDILKRMDAAAPQFKSMSASLKRLNYSMRWDEKEEKTGTMRMQRTKDGPAALWDFTGKDPEVIRLKGKTARIYKPKASIDQEYKAGKEVSSLQETLLLGFGARIADLKKTYDIQAGAADTVGGKHATVIQLTPKSKDLKDIFTRIDLWIPDGESNPVQEKIWKGTKGDYILATYSDLKINPNLPDSAFEFTPPAGTQVIQAN